MGGNTRESGLFSVIAMVLAAATPLIAVPTAMLTMSSRESGSVNKPPTTPKNTAAKQKPSRTSEPEKSPSDQLLKEFFGRNLEEPVKSVRKDVLPEVNSKFNVRGLIVTLPDPQDSSLVSLFDVRLDVLRKAAATHGYTVNRFYLPWKRDRSESEALELSRHEPGLLLFRRGHQKRANEEKADKDETDVLLMYLVGETPTTGVQYQAFHKAVDRLLFWTRKKPSQDQWQHLDVIAPSFSGAADSLARAIQSADSQGVPFRVLSGAANSLDQERFELLSGKRASLYSTRPSASRCQSELLQFVFDHRLSKRPLRIAWLVESSGFGVRVSGPNDPVTEKAPLPAKVLTPEEAQERAKAQNKETAQKKEANRSIEITNFSFPLHVARVRRELEKRRSKQAPSPLHASPLNESQLELGDDEASTRLDVTPVFAPGITPALDELQLRQVMTTIRQGEFSYVGITATDPRDTAFLCELIRQHCPDAQILLIGGSTTFVHPTHRKFMRGALTATGYPLHLPTQSWTFPWGANPAPPLDSGDRPPSWMMAPDSDGSAGIYNAAVLLLATPKQGKWIGPKFTLASGDPSEPNPELQLIDYSEPFDVVGDGGFQPTVWISAVGNETLVPLAARKSDVPADSNSSPPLVTVARPKSKTDRHPQVVFPFSGGVFAALLATITAFAWLISLELSRRAAPALSPELLHAHRGWWRTWTDHLIPLLLPRSREPQLGERYSPRKRQLGALLIASLGLCLMTTWLTGLTFVPVILNAHAAGTKCFWVSLVVVLSLCSFVAAWVDTKCRALPATLPPEAVYYRTWLPQKVRWIVGITVLVGAFLYATGLEFRNPAGDGDRGHNILQWLGLLVCFHCAWFWMAVALSFIDEMSLSPKQSRRWVVTAFVIPAGLLVARGLVSGLKLDGQGVLDGEWVKWAVLRFAQTMSVTNHVSLLQSTLWLVLAIIAWSGFVLRRLLVGEQHKSYTLPWERMSAEAQSENPLAAVSARMTHTKDFIDLVLSTGCRALRRNFTVSFVVTFSAALLWLAHLARWSAVSFDSVWITRTVWAVGGVASLAWLHTFWQAVVLRQMIHKLLRQMAWMTMLTESLGRLPERIRIVVGSFMDIRRKRASYFRIRVHYLAYLLQHLAAVEQRPHWAGLLTSPVPLPLSRAADEIIQCMLDQKSGLAVELCFCEELQHVPVASGPQDNRLSPIPVTRDTLNHFGMRVWNGLLNEWHDRPPQKLYPSGMSSDDELSKGVKKLADHLGTLNRSVLPPALLGTPVVTPEVNVSADDWVRAAEEFVAMQVVGYLHNVLTFLYSLIWFLLAMTVLFVLGALTWPLQPQKLLTATAIAMLLLVTVFCVLALLALERDRVHSILRGTTPDRVDFDRSVLLKLATCLAPGALLLSSYIFPSAMQWLKSLIEPVMHSAQ